MDTASHTFSAPSRPLHWWTPFLAAVLLAGLFFPWTAYGQSTPPIRPQSSSLQASGSTFWIDVQVGSDQAPVQDLFGASFTMTYDTSRVDVLNDEAGPFLGNDVVYSSNVDPTTGEVGIGVSRKSGAGGVDGKGVVARIEVQVESDVPDGDTLEFRLPDVDANDPDGNTITLDPGPRGVTVGTAVPMQSGIQVLSGETDGTPAPGDTIAVDVNVGTSAIPISDLFGTSFTWTYDPGMVSVLSDTAGAFLGTDLVYSSNLDTTNGTLGVGVSRKAGAGGVDGAGSVARVVARIDPDVTEGSALTFGLADAQAKNPADSSIALSAADSTIIANAIPAPPQSLGGTANGQNVALTWTPPSEPDLQRYRIYRDTASIDSSAGPSGLTPLDSIAADTTGFADSTGAPGTTYYYRVTAVDSLGSESGVSNEVQATPTAMPTATTDSVSSVTDSSAVLYGTVNAGGETTEVQFRYYPSGSPSQADTALAAESPLSNAQDEAVSAAIDTFKAGVNYTYQTVASNSVGSDSGVEQSFQTKAEPPVARTGPTGAVTDTSATLEATVNPGGDSTTVTFEYGVDTSYGSTTTADTITGPDPTAVSAEIRGLVPGTTYHYRAVATNGVGQDAGADSTFETEAVPPVATTDSVRALADTTATLYGTVNPGGEATQVQFRYYPTGSPSAADTARASESPVRGTQDQVVSATVTALQSGTDYTYQVLAANSAGTGTGGAVSFTTGIFPPMPRNDTTLVQQGAATTLNVLANDTAEGGLAPSTVTVETAPSNGTATVSQNGTITYTHDGSSTLSDTFTYSVADQRGQRSNPATVVVNGVVTRASLGNAVRDSAVSVGVEVEGNFAPNGVLYAREGGTTDYQEINLTVGAQQPLRLTGEIPASLVTTRGVDYYIVLSGEDETLTVPAGGESQAQQRPRHLTVSFSTLEVPVQLESETYRMMTASVVPEEGVKSALEANYGAYDRAEWRVLRWDPTKGGDGGYREYPSIDGLNPGEGFWLITAFEDELVLDAGQTVEGSLRTIALEQGWNQVGSPFDYAVPWDTIQTASGLDPGSVDGPVAYEDGEYQYERTALQPWESAFVRVPEADTLVVPPAGVPENQRETAQGPVALVETTSSKSGDAPTPPYTIRLTAGTSAETTPPVWLGLRAGAERGRDTLDFAQAPQIRSTVRLSVQETVAGRTVPHAGSFKPPSSKGQFWTVRLSLPETEEEAAEVKLQLREKGLPPEGQRLYMLDLSADRRLTPGATVELAPGEERRLRMIVGTEMYAKNQNAGVSLTGYETTLRGNYPNPFGQQTTLEYTLDSERAVTVEVYDVLGRRIQTLIEDKKQKAGLHRIRWDGTTRYGEPAGNGVYLYRIDAGSFTETRKMVLIR